MKRSSWRGENGEGKPTCGGGGRGRFIWNGDCERDWSGGCESENMWAVGYVR